MTIEILKAMAKENQVFSFAQLYQKTHIKKEMLWVILSRMEEKGFIERIEKGKYLIIPLGSEKGKYTLHEFVIASYLVEPYAISYWSALHHYGLTEQIPGTVFVQTPARKKKNLMEIFGVNYQIVRVKEDKFFGLRKEWIEENSVSITDKEKTIIDCLEIVQIKAHQSKGVSIPAGSVDFHIDQLNKASSVLNAGQKIDSGELFFLLYDVFQRRENESEDKKGTQSCNPIPIRDI